MKRYALDINFVCPGMPFDGDTLASDKSLGGSETACLSMARELAKRGHKVAVFSNTNKPGMYDGVDYKPVGDWPRYLTMIPHDVTIVQRMPEAFSVRCASKVNILWQHDLALRGQSARFGGVLWNVDRVFTVSKWHAEQYASTMQQPETVFHPTRNGIDVDRIRGIPSIGRNRKVLIYTARPERGLDILLTKIFPELLRRDPELELRIAGYDNTVAHMAPVYAALQGHSRQFGDKVKWLGPLSKSELYRQYKQAGVYVYPTPSDGLFINAANPEVPANGFSTFREVSCITAMETAAAGLPFVSSKIGALPETCIPGAGALVDVDTEKLWDTDHVDRFCDAVMSFVNDEAAWKTASEIGREQAVKFAWGPVAVEWEDVIFDILEKSNNSKARLARHFMRHSDIMAAQALLEEPEDDAEKDLHEILYQHWGPLLRGDEQLVDQYTKIGAGHTDVFHQSRNEPRLQYAIQWLKDRPHIRKVLDVGCAHGSYAIHIANETGAEVVGVDIDPNSVNKAIEWATDPERCKARVQPRFYLDKEFEKECGNEKFDAVFMFEVLEHVTDPTSFMDKWEPWCKPDGRVLITVPYGPWEYMSYHTYPYRCHLWEYDLHDIRDLFGKKKDSSIKTMPYGTADFLAEPIGWRWVEYQAGDVPTGTVDMARKLAVQAPKQTVSVCIIAGTDPNAVPPEDTLHWCLRSLHHIADEIIIGDCGLSEEAHRIIQQHRGYLYKIKVVRASDPKFAGYETPRNEILAHARGDWILWIDTDEKVLGDEAVHKYLRPNFLDGYGIRQHHFTVDANFNPDRPVRLFRRIGNDGRASRWFGMIHEHPEKGLNEGPGPVMVLSDVNIPHLGYLRETIRRKRFERNYPLLLKDKEKYPDRLLQQHFIMRDNVQLAKYERQQTGGRLSEESRRMLWETIDLWREHFRGKSTIMSSDSLQFYSEACVLLGIGFEAGFAFTHAKQGLNGAGMEPMRARWATKDDMVEELSGRMAAAVQPYDTEWY